MTNLLVLEAWNCRADEHGHQALTPKALPANPSNGHRRLSTVKQTSLLFGVDRRRNRSMVITMHRADAGKLTGWVTSLAILLYLTAWLFVFKDYWPPQGGLRNVLFWGRCALGALAVAAFNPLSWRVGLFSTLSRRLTVGATWIASEVTALIFL